MTSEQHRTLRALTDAALASPGLLPPNEFNLARYSLYEQTRNRLLDPDILALEDYFIDHIGLPDADPDLAMLSAFADVVHAICADENTALRTGYQHMVWLLTWLNIHHPPSFFGEDSDSPLQALQMAAALGMGEWAAAYHHTEEGLRLLLEQANSPLPRVRAIAVLGMQRLLQRTWERAQRRMRYIALAANAREWQAMLSASSGALPVAHPGAVVDVLDLSQQALRYVARQTAPPDDLSAALAAAIARLAPHHPKVVFLYLAAWARWPAPSVQVIVRGALDELQLSGAWGEDIAWVAGHLAD